MNEAEILACTTVAEAVTAELELETRLLNELDEAMARCMIVRAMRGALEPFGWHVEQPQLADGKVTVRRAGATLTVIYTGESQDDHQRADL